MTTPTPAELRELPYLTPAQVAGLEGRSVDTIRAWLHAGRFPGAFQLQPSGYWRIPNPLYVGDPAPATVKRRPEPVVDLDRSAAAALGNLMSLPTRPARAASIALQALTRTVDRHATANDTGELCATCLWPYPCGELWDALTALDRTLDALGPEYAPGGAR